MEQLVKGKPSQKDITQRLDVTARQLKHPKRSDIIIDMENPRGRPSNRHIADVLLTMAIVLISIWR
jgi:hypothetical protein